MKAFFLILFLAVGLATTYVLWHVWHLLPLPAWLRWALCILLMGCVACLFVCYGIGPEQLSLKATTILYEVGNSALIILLYLTMLFVALDILRLLHIVPSSLLNGSWKGTLGVLLLMGATFTYGYVHYLNKVRLPLDLTTTKHLTRPYRIVLMSDLHLGFHNRRAELAKWVDKVNAERPDLVLIAGDIIDISVRPLLEEGMAAEFQRLSAPVYACLGNHEYFASEPRARQFFNDAGIHLLRDGYTCIGKDLCIIGRDDRTNAKRSNLAQILQGVNRERYLILLDHQPYHLEEAMNNDIDFQFSGHTHHGQVWPISWVTEKIYECAHGPHRKGTTQYFVSSGIGIWGGKFRIGTQSEYIVATISN